MSVATLDWDRDGADWPNRRASRFVEASGLRWHVQRIAHAAGNAPRARTRAPVLLLLHGTGAATHSWRTLAPLLAQSFDVVAPDLPGHGFTTAPRPARLSLDGMSDATAALLRALNLRPAVVVGHSAGAAIAARMCLDGEVTPRLLISLNGALLPWRGVPGMVFPPLARLLALNPVVPTLFAWRAGDAGAIERLIAGTGSVLDERGRALYARVVQSRAHVAATLGMMAHWDLRALARELPALAPQLVLVSAARDRAVPPAEAQRVQALVPGARHEVLAGLGHLAHEEAPQRVAALIVSSARAAGVAIGTTAPAERAAAAVHEAAA